MSTIIRLGILAVGDLSKSFGGVHAVDRVGFSVGEGELLAMIGPNGAGKTTFINLLTGVLAPSAGTVLLKGRDITHVEQAEPGQRPEGRERSTLGTPGP